MDWEVCRSKQKIGHIGKLSCHVHLASVPAKSKQHLPDLIKKHCCLNCHDYLLERVDLLICMYNRGNKNIAIRFCF